MDDELLNALYGVSDEQYDDDDLIKEAQAELVESVAAEAGIDLDELDDDELDKFAEYVLTGGEGGDMSDPALAEADRMGRAMAHAYADEQIKIAHMIDEGSYPGLEYDEYDEYENALYAQAARWEMLKEAGAGPTGDFGDLSYADRMRIAKGKFGKDDAGKKYTLSDTDYSKRQRAMAMIGRGTGYYDIGSGRKILRDLKKQVGSVGDAKRKQLMKLDSHYRNAMKQLSAADIKAYRHALIKRDAGAISSLGDTAFRDAATSGKARHLFLSNAEKMRLQLMQEELARSTGRRLIARGAGKAALTAGAGGVALYGLKRAFGN